MTAAIPELSGLMIPPVVPFSDHGVIDRKNYIRQLHWLAESGVRRLLINGTTGEFFSLAPEERRQLFLIARREFEWVLLYHAGRNSLPETIEEAMWGEDNGADAIITLPPFYYADSPEQGIIDYLNTVSDSVSKPFLIYNFPRHTQNGITAEMLRQIRHHGVKDSSADFSLAAGTPMYLLGGDKKIQESLDKECAGFVSASANAAPGLYVEMERAWRAKDIDAVERLQKEVDKICGTYTGTNAIPMLKRAVARQIQGYPTRVRPPLIETNRG